MLWTRSDSVANRRIDSWKEIATFFRRDERTVKRWEKTKFLPVHRIPGSERGGVFAYTLELTQWLNTPLSVNDGRRKPHLQPVLRAVNGNGAQRKLLSVTPGNSSVAKESPRLRTLKMPAAAAESPETYSIYRKHHSGALVEYEFVKRIGLFGWRDSRESGGWLPSLLRQHIAATPVSVDSPSWHISRDELQGGLESDVDSTRNSLLVEYNRNEQSDVELYEIVEIWGYSLRNSTSMMLHLKRLACDGTQTAGGRRFSICQDAVHDPQSVLALTYTPNGTIKGGRMIGNWPPPPGPTNSVLLRPAALEYFAGEVKKMTAAAHESHCRDVLPIAR